MSEKLTCHWEGDYLIPDLIPPESPHIGIWGERRRKFLRSHQRAVYDAMMMHDKVPHFAPFCNSCRALRDAQNSVNSQFSAQNEANQCKQT